MSADLIPFLLALIVTGCFAGIIAGLFGIGGGVVMVPALYFVLTSLGYGETAMHAAVGTSLMVIVSTSLRSVSAHAKRGAVDFQVLKQWTPWIVLGALSGSFIADLAPGRVLTGLFGLIALVLSAQFFFGRPDWRWRDSLPGQPVKGLLGAMMGILSSLMGVGGGVFGVTLMTLCGRTIHNSVATAAGFGVAIGLPGAIGFMIGGLGEAGRAPFSLGYVNMAAFVVLAGSAFMLAPVGANLAHKLPEGRLRRAFAVGLVFVALNMLREAIWA